MLNTGGAGIRTGLGKIVLTTSNADLSKAGACGTGGGGGGASGSTIVSERFGRVLRGGGRTMGGACCISFF